MRRVGRLTQQGTLSDASTGCQDVVRRMAGRTCFQTQGFMRRVEQGEIEGFPGQDLDLEIWQIAWP